MDKFFDRFKPKKNKNPLGNLFGGQKSFSGQGQALGGGQPGQVLEMTLSEPGSLGLHVEKRPQSQTAIVSKVVPGSQADKAGLQRGDILCFQGSNGTEEILYDLFLQLAKSDQRPLCFDIRRIKIKQQSSDSQSADALARKQAVIAAAEKREKAAKSILNQKVKRVAPPPSSTTTTTPVEYTDEPQSEASRQAIAAAKTGEAKLAAELGYNPYETNKGTAGQARTATSTVQHGAMGTSGDELPKVAPPKEVTSAAKDPVSPEFEQAWETTVTSNDHETVVSSLSILVKLLTNATTKTEEKFRKVRLGNAKIRAAVVDVEGALDLMLSCGFQLHEDAESGESVLVYTSGPDFVPTVVKRMEKYMKS